MRLSAADVLFHRFPTLPDDLPGAYVCQKGRTGRPLSGGAGAPMVDGSWRKADIGCGESASAVAAPIADINQRGQTKVVNSYADSHTVPVECPYCGQMGHAVFGQSVPDGKLRWYRSTYCPTARQHIEEDGDGIGDAPSEYREKLLAAKGSWSVRADEREKLKAIATTKRLLSISLADTAGLLQSFPTLYRGTRAEADWLIEMLAKEGIKGKVVQVGSEGQ